MISVTITRKQLESLEACEEGLDFFDTIAPSGTLQIDDWAMLHDVWLRRMSCHYRWLIVYRVIPTLSLSNANLERADLRHANLERADLRYADLRYADLRGADLRYANLEGANLERADLRHADLRHADLRSAKLRSADLRSANSLRAWPGWVLEKGRLFEEGKK